MRKIIVGISLIISCSFTYAQTCPQPFNVYKVEGNKVIPVAPDGWNIYWKANLDNTDVRFAYAGWTKTQLNPKVNKKMECVYGNPEYTSKGLILISTNKVDYKTFKDLPQWVYFPNEPIYGDKYYRCTAQSVEQCPFG